MTDLQRNVSARTVSNEQGFYLLSSLAPGHCPDPNCHNFYQRQQNAALDYTLTAFTTALIKFRYGFGRGILDRASRYLGCRPSAFGFPTDIENAADYTVFPQFGMEEMTPPGPQHHWNFRNSSDVHDRMSPGDRR